MHNNMYFFCFLNGKWRIFDYSEQSSSSQPTTHSEEILIKEMDGFSIAGKVYIKNGYLNRAFQSVKLQTDTVPEMPDREETCSTSYTELQLFSPQRPLCYDEVPERIRQLYLSEISQDSFPQQNLPCTKVTTLNKEGTQILFVKTVFKPPWNMSQEPKWLLWCCGFVFEDRKLFCLISQSKVNHPISGGAAIW